MSRRERLLQELEAAETAGDNARRAKMGAMQRQMLIAEVRVRTLTLRIDLVQIDLDNAKTESRRDEYRSERAQLLTHIPKAELSVRAASKQLADDLLQELKDRLDQQDTLTTRAMALHH